MEVAHMLDARHTVARHTVARRTFVPDAPRAP